MPKGGIRKSRETRITENYGKALGLFRRFFVVFLLFFFVVFLSFFCCFSVVFLSFFCCFFVVFLLFFVVFLFFAAYYCFLKGFFLVEARLPLRQRLSQMKT